ncbi:hypothetical protein Acr_03g0009680 [Actinidia rufa]|uniref:Reverse transcriptase domain-containing protein n=1 Tax=Actinidia rufa TaxID=165716 RepID=A0A7J0ECF9_9ERIC|nr:hypothetical protein Acr_03g0009680 [Actinidia rufa]
MHCSIERKGIGCGGQGKFGGLREDKPGHTLSGHLFNSSSGMPWMLLGDFNNVLSIEEKANGLPVTPYEMRDFKSCCYDTGMSDIRSSGVFFTWSNNAIWSKLDRVMVNRNWVHEGLQAHARFDLPGKFSDHSPCTLGQRHQKKISQELGNNCMTVQRTRSCQASIPELRAKAIKLAEAELRQMLKQINHAVLALIPKSKAADRVEDFRPIACCNVMYKPYNFLPDLLDGSWNVLPPHPIPFLFNGAMHGFFKGQRGLRQGDPLSPYLFVICLEYLSRGLGQLKNNADFNFHPKCGGLKITHLAFADDLVLLSRGDPKSVYLLMQNLSHFGECSGLKVSISKSSLFAAGINSEDLDSIKEISGFSQGSFPFRYLGIPVADSRLTIAQFSPLIDKITDYISAWAGANLSYAGRTELVKSVLQGVECFWLTILPIPAGVKAKIVQICRNFLWSGSCSSHKRPLVSWKEVTLPKDEGGLGIGDIKAWNKALISKTFMGHSSQEGLHVVGLGLGLLFALMGMPGTLHKMTRVKSKKKQSDQQVLDALLVNALARSASSSQSRNEEGQAGEEVLEENSVAASQTLGDEDTYSLSDDRGMETENNGAGQGETPDSGAEKKSGEVTQQQQKKSYLSLFAKNRMPTTDSKLNFVKLDEGPKIIIQEEDIHGLNIPWEKSLVGYFGGKFPVTLQLPGGVDHEQAIFYENLPRYCPQCRMMGHSKGSCKRSKAGTSEDQPTKSTGFNSKKGKELEADGPEEGGNQRGKSGEGTSKEMEWVIKKAKASKSQANKNESRGKTGSTAGGMTSEAQTANKFSPLQGIPENEENQTQDQSEIEAEVQANPETEVRAEPDAQNQVEPEPEADDQIQDEGTSNVRVTKTPVAKKKQVGEAIYVQQAIQITSEEFKTKLKQASKGSSVAAPPRKLQFNWFRGKKQRTQALDLQKNQSLQPLIIRERKERKGEAKRIRRRKGNRWTLRSFVQKWGVTPLTQPSNDHCILEHKGSQQPLKQSGISKFLRKNKTIHASINLNLDASYNGFWMLDFPFKVPLISGLPKMVDCAGKANSFDLGWDTRAPASLINHLTAVFNVCIPLEILSQLLIFVKISLVIRQEKNKCSIDSTAALHRGHEISSITP